jgi:hypothetical protein
LRVYALLLALLVLCPLANAAANPRIVPLQTSAAFFSAVPENRWSVLIRATDGRIAYVLSLEPEFDIGNHLVTLELVLRRSGDKANATNLLAPNERWHGLQPWMFNANDLASGPQKSGFGNTRSLSLKRLGLMLKMDISDAAVSPISSGSYQLDAIHLQVEIENWH